MYGITVQTASMPMKKPPHPGRLIRTEIIEALGLSVSKAAAILKVRRATLSDLLAGKAALSPEMALRIEKAFGPDMDHIRRMQLAYDVAETRQHCRGISVKRYVPARELFVASSTITS
jgi:addiction module HigA family antidote